MDTANHASNGNQHPNIVEYNLDDLLLIDENNLSVEYAKQSSRYASFATKLATLDYEVSRTKALVEQERSAADLAWRDEFKDKGIKYTETSIAAVVSVDVNVITAEDNYRLAVVNRDSVKAIVRALEMRAEMLISLGATMRHEMAMTGMQINDYSPDMKQRIVDITNQARISKNQP